MTDHRVSTTTLERCRREIAAIEAEIRAGKPERLKTSKLVDGIMALVMAMSQAMVDDR